MLDKTTATHSIGLAISGHQLIGSHLECRGGNPVIRSFYSVTLNETESETPEELSGEENAVEKKDVKQLYSYGMNTLPPFPDDWLVISALRASKTLTRTLEVSLTKPQDVASVIEFQAEPQLPYRLEEATLDHIQVSRTAESTLATVVSIRNSDLDEHIEQMRLLSLEPEVVSCVPAALAAFSHQFSTDPGSDKPVFILHIELDETIRVLASGGNLLASHRLSLGASHLVHAISRDIDCSYDKAYETLMKLDFLKISKSDHPALHSTFQSLKLEIAKTLYALAKEDKAQLVEEILITGVGGTLSNLPEALSKDLPTAVNAPKSSGGQSAADLQKFAVPIGLALSALPNTPSQINFRQNEYEYPHPWKRYKKPLALYFILCVLASFALYYLGQSWISYKSTDVQIRYSELLASLDRPYSEFEAEYQEETTGTSPDELPHLARISAPEISRRVLYLQDKIRKTPRSFPLFPEVPRVSDFLAWLATHPQIQGDDPETPALKIESISYTMTRRPQKNKTADRYQVRVEIEFTTPMPRLARQFRDALMAPNEMVDPRAEVQWTSTRDVYQTSFFLKDRTSYP